MTKATNVMSVSFQPWAECLGVDDETPCPAEWSFGQSPSARYAAKKHAEFNPGHRLRVVAEKVDLYRAEPS